MVVCVVWFYYFQNMIIVVIVDEIGILCVIVLCLLFFVLDCGLVEICVYDLQQVFGSLEVVIVYYYCLKLIQVVFVVVVVIDKEILQWVICYVVVYVNFLVMLGIVIGLVWGMIVVQIVDQLLLCYVYDVDVVVLNGFGSGVSFINSFSEFIVLCFVQNYGVCVYYLLVLVFFDYFEMCIVLW